MVNTKFTYEQYCTHLKKNIIIEETLLEDGTKKIVCTNTKCVHNEKDCRNKLRQNN